MITALRTTPLDLLTLAAASIVGTLASGEPLLVGEPVTNAEVAELDGTAVVAQLSGTVSGELVLVVDGELTGALAQSTIGPLDLLAALTPTLRAAAIAMGPVVLGSLEQMDAQLALDRVLAQRDCGLLPLLGTSGMRAAVAIGLTIADAPRQSNAPSSERLDLLRGVEMSASAELGRARMTVNDLLSLRTGTVIELDRAAGAPADLFVNGRLIAHGEVVVVDENYGLRVTHVVTDDAGR